MKFKKWVKNVKDKTTPAEKCGIGVEGNAWETLLISAIKNNNGN